MSGLYTYRSEGKVGMVKSLVVFGWLRDLVIVLLFFAGNHVRHTSPMIGITIIVSASIVLVERFLWSWHVGNVSKLDKFADSDPEKRGYR